MISDYEITYTVCFVEIPFLSKISAVGKMCGGIDCPCSKTKVVANEIHMLTEWLHRPTRHTATNTGVRGNVKNSTAGR